MDEICVDVEEAARRIGLGRSQTYELVMNGEIASFTEGKRRLVPLSALHEWVRAKLAAGSAATALANRANNQ
jgi:excisionase family DNA binding protein